MSYFCILKESRLEEKGISVNLSYIYELKVGRLHLKPFLTTNTKKNSTFKWKRFEERISPSQSASFQSLYISILNDCNSVFIGDLQQTWIHALEPGLNVLSIPLLKSILCSLHPTIYDFNTTIKISSNWSSPILLMTLEVIILLLTTWERDKYDLRPIRPSVHTERSSPRLFIERGSFSIESYKGSIWSTALPSASSLPWRTD